MFPTLAFICFGLFYGYASGFPANTCSFDLEFPREGTSDYVQMLGGMPSLTQFTICFRMKTNKVNEGTPISYSSSADPNDILIFKYAGFDFRVNNYQRITHVSANDGQWHHICAKWRNTDGAWMFYKDGVCHAKGINFRVGSTISPGGSLVLGQEQDSHGGGFVASQSFQGTLTDVNIWSSFLSDAQIASQASTCFSAKGDVYSWHDFLSGLKGQPKIIIPSGCQGN